MCIKVSAIPTANDFTSPLVFLFRCLSQVAFVIHFVKKYFLTSALNFLFPSPIPEPSSCYLLKVENSLLDIISIMFSSVYFIEIFLNYPLPKRALNLF